MAQTQQEETRAAPTGMPLQRISWSKKQEDGQKWFKDNVDYRIKLSNFNFGTAPGNRKDIRALYDIYNNQFPLEWFAHITDPLSAQDKKHRQYPAKIRPTAMLRTNIDLLLEEFNRRPFTYTVDVLGEDGYNRYTDSLMKAIEKNLQEHFLAVAQQEMAAAGHQYEEVPQDEQIELPDSIKERFAGSYKDNIAIQGQKWTKRALREYQMRRKFLKEFKDWLIAGYTFSYKNIENNCFIYDKVSPLEIAYSKSPDKDFIEDGEWAVRRKLMTISDVVDEFYSELTEKDHKSIETKALWTSPEALFTYLRDFSTTSNYGGRVPVYHATWKGKKEIKYVDYTDPLTGQTHEDVIMDEDTPLVDASMEVTKTEWVNEVYEGWRIGDNIYPRMRPLPVQRNEMNNFSTCKLPYNGRLYSDTHSENISVLEMGLPYAIMYMVTNFILEKTIAKNKGKIVLFDKNAIPRTDGWDDEKFFYYADALGYALLNRNQQGVDKSFNQYSVLDMSLFADIERLITLRDSFAADWDKLLGVNLPRKGQGDTQLEGLGVQQNALAQSSVVTGMIFTLFEEFLETEMQGLLDYSRFVNADGIRAIYNSDDFDTQLLSIDPNSYCNAELGIFFNFSSEQLDILRQFKANIQAMIQNGYGPDTILDIQMSNNIAELKEKLKSVKEIALRQAQAQQQAEQEHEMSLEQMKESFLRIEKMLEGQLQQDNWDRTDQNTMLKGEIDAHLEQLKLTGETEGTEAPNTDYAELNKRIIAQQQIASQERQTAAQIQSDHLSQNKQIAADMTMQDKDLKFKEQDSVRKAAVARIKKKQSTPKSKKT